MRTLRAVAHEMSRMRWKENPTKRGLTRIPEASLTDFQGTLRGTPSLLVRRKLFPKRNCKKHFSFSERNSQPITEKESCHRDAVMLRAAKWGRPWWLKIRDQMRHGGMGLVYPTYVWWQVVRWKEQRATNSTTPPPPFDMGNGREARCSPQDQMGVSYPVKQ